MGLLKKKKQESDKLKLVTSTQSSLPVRDVKDGIIITKDGRFVKMMEFSPINFALRSNSEQAAIISTYAAAVRIMPDTVQFKVISRRADVSNFVEKIEEEMAVEPNEKCRELQAEQIEMIRSIGESQGITRRFLLIFQYEEKSSFQKRPTFERIKAELEREARIIEGALEQCGNICLSNDDDEYILSTLWSIISRGESMCYTFEERVNAVISRNIELYNEAAMNDIKLPVGDFIAPAKIDTTVSPRYMKIDNTYYMFCYIPSASYPVRALGGWLTILINMGTGIDIDFWFHKEPVESTQRKLQYKLRYNKVKFRDTEDTAQDYDDLYAAIESGYYLKHGISEGDDFCYFATLITITATSLDELNFKYDAVKQHCIRHDIRIKQCLFQQGEAFESSLPLCKYNPSIWKKSRRNILASSLASTYPFVSFEMTDENGILLGRNIDNGTLVFVDIFDTRKYNNSNVAILGSSGSGKTYTLQCMALRMREKGIQVFIIAPLKGMEFSRACNAVGGTFVKVAPGSGNNINIMEIRPKDSVDESLLSDNFTDNTSILMSKIQQLHAFFSLIVPDMSYAEKQVLDEALIKTYEKFGITAKNKSLIDRDHPGRFKKMPVLGDLYRQLEGMENGDRLHSVLRRYVEGSAKSFNMQTNVDLDNKYVVMDVSSLTKELLTVGMFIALDYVWDKARENRTKKKVIFIDEAWRLIGAGSSVEVADFVLEIFKVIRGYGGSAVAATQDLNDFFALDNGRFGSGIINNSKIKMLMKTEPKEAEVVANAMDLTTSEAEQIKKIKRGTCLLAANTNHVFIEVEASKTEHELITTDANDLARIASKKRFEKLKEEAEEQ